MSAHIALIKGDGVSADVCPATTYLVNLFLRLVGKTPITITKINAGTAYFQETGADIEAGGENAAASRLLKAAITSAFAKNALRQMELGGDMSTVVVTRTIAESCHSMQTNL